MDFTNRSQQSNSTRPGGAFSPVTPEEPAHKPKSERVNGDSLSNDKTKWVRWGGGILIIIVALLIAAALALFFTFKPVSQSGYVDNSKLQAVFLTNDQVYFGKITDINSKYVVLTNIYYLQTSTNSTSKTSNTNSNVSLVKLGCELHKPQDQMVINQDQVSFWENLQGDGQVAKAVSQYEKANPNGQTCSTTSTQTNPVQGSSENSSSNQSSTSNTSTTNTNNSTKTNTGTSTSNNSTTNQ